MIDLYSPEFGNGTQEVYECGQIKSAKSIRHDPVTNPSHYKAKNGFEVLAIIEAFDLNFHRGNTVKYILRAPNKNNELEDLKKARFYLDREIKNLEMKIK